MCLLKPIAARPLFLCLLAGFNPGWGVAQTAGGEVRIEIRGQILPRCEISGAPSSLVIGGPAIGQSPGVSQIVFQLSCNTPFSYALASNGALRNPEGAPPAGFSAELPYRTLLTIAADDRGSLILECDPAQISSAGECRGHSGEHIAIDQPASLTIGWERLARPLAVGTYTDELRIALSAGI